MAQRKSKPAKGKAIKKTAPTKAAKIIFTEPIQPLELVSTSAMFTQLGLHLALAADNAAQMARTYARWAAGEPFDGDKTERDRAAFAKIVRPSFVNAADGLRNFLNFMPAPEVKS